MTSKPSSKGSNPKLLRMIGQAAVRAGEANNDSRMKAAGERALARAERSEAAARKAIRKGKSGFVTEDGQEMIIEK